MMQISRVSRIIVAATACGAALFPTQLSGQTDVARPTPAHMIVYKNASCGCCEHWVEHLRHHGFNVTVRDVTNLQDVKAEHGIPASLASCHTGIIDGYVIEGHIPADVILRLLQERPDIAGLAVPGMPIGSPGMEMEGREPRPYDVIAFTRDGRTRVFAKR